MVDFTLLQEIFRTLKLPQCIYVNDSFIRYAEVCKPGYSFDSGQGTGGTGHFTQVVWKESTTLGIGKATAKKNGMICTYVVGRYKKAGNFMGKYKENVEKGSFSRSVCEKLDEMIANIGGGNIFIFALQSR